jgi:hypothetical protein
MGQQGKFLVDGFSLTLNSECYLVEVQERPEIQGVTEASILPDWIFESKHAIWLMEENKPIADRARDGERVRQVLLRFRNEMMLALR